MEYSLQVQLARELFEHIDAGTTCLADSIATNPIVSYTDPDRLDREMQILFRRYPLMMGLGCRIPEPGDYFTDDNCGVPILIVRDHDGDVRAFVNIFPAQPMSVSPIRLQHARDASQTQYQRHA